MDISYRDSVSRLGSNLEIGWNLTTSWLRAVQGHLGVVRRSRGGAAGLYDNAILRRESQWLPFPAQYGPPKSVGNSGRAIWSHNLGVYAVLLVIARSRAITSRNPHQGSFRWLRLAYHR